MRKRKPSSEVIDLDRTGRAIGRPTKLTREVLDSIVTHLTEGSYPECASVISGITEKTYYNWMETGEAHAEHEKNTIFAEFFQSCSKAIRIAEHAAVKQMRAGGRDWMGASEYLSRRFRDRWHRSDRITVDGSLKLDVTGLRDRLLADVSREVESA